MRPYLVRDRLFFRPGPQPHQGKVLAFQPFPPIPAYTSGVEYPVPKAPPEDDEDAAAIAAAESEGFAIPEEDEE